MESNSSVYLVPQIVTFRVFANVIIYVKMRSEARWALHLMTVGLVSYEYKATFKDRGRDWSDATINQGTPGIAGSHKKPGERPVTGSPSQPVALLIL